MTSIWNAPEMDLVAHLGMTDQNKGKLMGQCYRFICTKCKCEIEAPSGSDSGFEYATKPMRCTSCGNLFDQLIATNDGKGYKPVEHPDPCPRCGSDALEKWEHKTRICPRCGGMMKRGELLYLWD